MSKKSTVLTAGGALAFVVFLIFGVPLIMQVVENRKMQDSLEVYLESVKRNPNAPLCLYTALQIDVFDYHYAPLHDNLDRMLQELADFWEDNPPPNGSQAWRNVAFETIVVVYATPPNEARNRHVSSLFHRYNTSVLDAQAGTIDVPQALEVDRYLHEGTEQFGMTRHEEFAARIWQEASTQARVSYFGYTPWFPKNHPLHTQTANSYFDTAILQADLEDARFIAKVMEWDKFDVRLRNLNEALMRRDFAQHLEVGMYENAIEISLNPEAPADLRSQAEELKAKTLSLD